METKASGQVVRNSFDIEQFEQARITADGRENIVEMILGGV
ncbi:MAG: hypothetical protein V7L00_20735 [Nostoc sp.]